MGKQEAGVLGVIIPLILPNITRWDNNITMWYKTLNYTFIIIVLCTFRIFFNLDIFVTLKIKNFENHRVYLNLNNGDTNNSLTKLCIFITLSIFVI